MSVVSTIDRLASWIGDTLAHHMLEVTDDPVVVLNADDRIVLLNRAAASLRWNRADLIGTPWSDLVHPDDVGCFSGEDDTAPRRSVGGLEPGRVLHDELLVRVRYGEHGWSDVSAVRYEAYLDAYGPVALIVLRPR